MQQVIFQQTSGTKFHSQATYLLPGHGTGTKTPASNDENYQQEESVFKMTMSVLANVIGGALLLTAMFNLPIILAVIWDI